MTAAVSAGCNVPRGHSSANQGFPDSHGAFVRELFVARRVSAGAGVTIHFDGQTRIRHNRRGNPREIAVNALTQRVPAEEAVRHGNDDAAWSVSDRKSGAKLLHQLRTKSGQ